VSHSRLIACTFLTSTSGVPAKFYWKEGRKERVYNIGDGLIQFLLSDEQASYLHQQHSGTHRAQKYLVLSIHNFAYLTGHYSPSFTDMLIARLRPYLSAIVAMSLLFIPTSGHPIAVIKDSRSLQVRTDASTEIAQDLGVSGRFPSMSSYAYHTTQVYLCSDINWGPPCTYATSLPGMCVVLAGAL